MASRSTSRPLPTEGPTAGGGDQFDDLDDLFNYDVADENDPFSDNYKVPGKKDSPKEPATKGSRNGAGLGIDEEVEVTKKPRVPRVKLDENRLLSANGIPKLRSKAKHLKFKGKGHEYSDAARLLAFYQLWLDDLFPKARFLDALAMVEKMGHKNRMKMMRMEWINEGKPKAVHEDSLFDDPELPSRENGEREKIAQRVAPVFQKSTTERPKTPAPEEDAEMDDLYDATPRAPRQSEAETQIGAADSQDSLFRGGASIFGPAKTTTAHDECPEDDLDALLAEEEMINSRASKTKPTSTASKPPAPQEVDFDDEMEAMAEMDDMW